MAKVATTETESLASWGFRIATSPGELKVVRDNETYNSETKNKRRAMLFLSIAFACAYYVVEFVRFKSSYPVSITWALPERSNNQMFGATSLMWAVWIFLPVLPLLIALEKLYSGAVNLSCTQETVQTTWIRFGKVRRIRSFQGTDVTQIRYVAGSNPFSGRADYLSFLAGGRSIKCLPGLKCVEAQLILNELERMGYGVVRDPEMATMVQMEQSRRNR